MPDASPSLSPAAWRNRALGVLVVALGSLAALFHYFSAISQDPGYFSFADAREFFGISNALNVLSNLGFVGVGLAGLILTARRRPAADGCYVTGWERRVCGLLFLGVFATGFGSAWFHHHPNDQTLFWDRLPMTLAFMPLLALIMAERMGLKTARLALPLLLLLGPGSVLFWSRGEARDAGDLRLYVFVQFFPRWRSRC